MDDVVSILQIVQTDSEDPRGLFFNGYRGAFLLRGKRYSLKLTIHFHPKPRLRIISGISPTSGARGSAVG
jgi:hypothetical protein